MVCPILETAALSLDVNVVYYIFSLVGLSAAVASILHYRETLGRPLLLYTSQLRQQREEDEKAPRSPAGTAFSQTSDSDRDDEI